MNPAVRIMDHHILNHRYRILAFDWDGTAVESRRHPTDELRERTEQLAEMGVWLAVITGTNFDNLLRQYFHLLSPAAKRFHIACVNRGSEVFGFDSKGHPETLHRRTATSHENHLMDDILRVIQAELKDRFSLESGVVFNRVNRRKLDLIPLPEWAEPPKERIGELLEAVKNRIRKAGIPGGIRTIMDRVEELAQDRGIALKLTTDVKHVEFGLTDKSDSVAYVAEELARPREIPLSDILILGDEFGPIDGFEGSDFKTFTLPEAAYVSVGKEPNGVPEGVIHVVGGVPAFLAILDHQIALPREEAAR